MWNSILYLLQYMSQYIYVDHQSSCMGFQPREY